MGFVTWVGDVGEAAGVEINPRRMPTGHIVDSLHGKSHNKIVFIDKTAAGVSSIRSCNTTFDASVGVPTVTKVADAGCEFISIAECPAGLLVLVKKVVEEVPSYVLEKRDIATLVVVSEMIAFAGNLTAVGDCVWLISSSGIFKKIDPAEMSFVVEKSYPSGEACGRAVYDSVMDLLILPRYVSSAEIYDANTGEFVALAPFGWGGNGQMSNVITPPHGDAHGLTAYVVELIKMDTAMGCGKVKLFTRDLANRNYLDALVEIPFATTSLPPYGATVGFNCLAVAFSRCDRGEPSDDPQTGLEMASRLTISAVVGNLPSSGNTPEEYGVIRLISLINFQSATVAAVTLPDHNPYVTELIVTSETARLWVGNNSAFTAEQKEYTTAMAAL